MSRASVAVLAATAMLLAGCGSGDGPRKGGAGSSRPAPHGPTIRIGTKNFTEQYILGQLYKQALEEKGFRVALKDDIGSSEIVDRALTAGSLDLYPEYTGVLLSEIAGQRREPRSATAAYQAAKAFEEKRGFTLLGMTPFTDSNALAVTPRYGRRHRLAAIGDLARIPGKVVIAAPPEFRTRFEGLAGLRSVYGLRTVMVRPYKIGEQYRALEKGDVSVAAVFTTDGQLVRTRLTVLRDPRHLFAFQNVAPVIRKSLADKYPEIRRTLDAVSAKLTTRAMQQMNAATVGGRTAEQVAAEFLRKQGLVSAPGG